MATLIELQQEMEPYKGTLVLDFDKLVLLIGVTSDEHDYYWIYGQRVGYKQSQQYWSSCVGGWVPLKGFIPEKKYEYLVRIWNLNNDPENQAI